MAYGHSGSRLNLALLELKRTFVVRVPMPRGNIVGNFGECNYRFLTMVKLLNTIVNKYCIVCMNCSL